MSTYTITWKPDNSPDAALRIAAHTMEVIAQMNHASTPREVKAIFDTWWTYARNNRVCRQICEHMLDKRKVLTGDKPKPTPEPVKRTAEGRQ